MYRITPRNTIFLIQVYVGNGRDTVIKLALQKRFGISHLVTNMCYRLGLWVNEVPMHTLFSFLRDYPDTPIRKRIVLEELPNPKDTVYQLGLTLRDHIKRTKSPVPLRFIFHIAQYIELSEIDDFVLSPITNNDRYIVSYVRCSLGEEFELNDIEKERDNVITDNKYLVRPNDIDLNAAIDVYHYIFSQPKYSQIVTEFT